MKSTSSRRALVEPMESRTLLTATVVGTPAVTNVDPLIGPQQNETITVDPANPSLVYLVANNNGTSLLTATSTNGGATWTPKVQFTGSDGFPAATYDAAAAYDSFGNLFIAYSTAANSSTVILYSYDNGATFHTLATLSGIQSIPSLAAGDGMVWLSLQQSKLTGNPNSVENSGAVAYVSKVTGLGRIAPLKKVESITEVNSTVESMAISNAGQVTVAYQYNTEIGPTVVYTETDPDGLGPKKFGPANSQVSTQVGTVDLIPAQPTAGITAGASLAYDNSDDAYTGRLYMAYVDAPSPSSASTSIDLVYSDDGGNTWSAPIQVNDDTSPNSHFMPQVAVDPVTGTVGVTWYDSRNDNGVPGVGGTNNVANDDVQVYGTVGTPTANGVSFAPNFVIQPAYSNASDIFATNGPDLNQFGLRNGLAFDNGSMIASWADNSDSTGNNGDGPLSNPDVYSSVVTVQTTPAPATATLLGVFGAGNPAYTYTASDGTLVKFNLNIGQGDLFANSSGGLLLRLSGTTTKSNLNITATKGSKTVTLSDVVVNGSLGSINAKPANLTGTFAIAGQVTHVVLGNLTGGSFSAAGGIGTMTVASLTNAKVLSGANPGSDLVFGTSDDTYSAGSIKSLVVNGAITDSVIGAGLNPVDGIFGNGNDVIVGGTASTIGTLRAASADAASFFAAGAFGTVKLPDVIDPAADSRFLVD